jgi:hypothetical protein
MSPAALINTPVHVAQGFEPAVSQVFKPAECARKGLRTESPRYGRLESLRYASPRP